MHTRPPHGGWHPGSCRTPREGAEDTGAAAPHRSAACERTTGEGPAKGCLVETRRGQGRRSGGALAIPAALKEKDDEMLSGRVPGGNTVGKLSLFSCHGRTLVQQQYLTARLYRTLSHNSFRTVPEGAECER